MNRSLVLFVLVSTFLVATMASAQARRGPFTRPPRSVRSRIVDQQHIRLELRFDWQEQSFTGRAVHTLEPFQPIKQVEFDAAEMKIERVRLLGADGQATPLEHETRAGQVGVTLDRERRVGERFTIELDYAVRRPNHGAHFVVPDESEPDQPRMVWTQSEPEYARFWFPCIDNPDDRVTSEIVATVPKGLYVLSNGALKSKVENVDGTETWHWEQTQSHVTYLMSVVAGDFEAFEQQWQGLPVISYVPRGRLADAARSFEKTAAMVDFFSRKIGVKYPWPKYTQICVDEYMWGGMEHTSATTLTLATLHDERAHLDVSSDGLVAHELAHQWFGDLLTCKDWGELWLNESFATYFAALWREHDLGWDEAVWDGHQDGEDYKQEDKQYRRPIVDYRYDDPNNMFDRHSYPKGGRVLHMLRFVLGDELFWRSIEQYVTRNQFRTVETADFRIAIEDATGQGLNWFFDQWVHHGGHPEFQVAWDWSEGSKTVRITVKQKQAVDQVTPLFKMPVEIEVARHGASTVHRVEVSKAEETFHFQADERPTRVCFDPNDWLLKDVQFEKSKEELLDQLTYGKSVVCRAEAASQLTRYEKDDDVQRSLAQAARSDPFWGVRREAVKALAQFTGDSVRTTLLDVAREDVKSAVRREATSALSRFQHEETTRGLRAVIEKDRSYFTVADAVRSLVKLEGAKCGDDLLAALATATAGEPVLRAACDGLVETKEPRAEPRLRELLSAQPGPERRAILIGTLARLKPQDAATLELLRAQLANDRRVVRSAAVDSLVQVGDARAIEWLLEARKLTESQRWARQLDTAIEQLRAKQGSVQQLRDETEALRKQNRDLERRLKELEEKSGK